MNLVQVYATSARLAILAGAIFLSNCTSDYKKFYRTVDYPPPPAVQPILASDPPRIVPSVGDPKADVNAAYEHGFGLIGYASFNGPLRDERQALRQATEVGATVVVLSQKYRNTVSGNIPLTLPTTQTTYSSGSVNVSGAGGIANGSYNGRSTTVGTHTTYIPYSFDRYNQNALFFAKLERRGLGLRTSPLDDQQRRALQTNSGLFVLAVRDGSPAFRADILNGDILLRLDNDPLYDQKTLHDLLAMKVGQNIILSIFRDERYIEKMVALPNGEW